MVKGNWERRAELASKKRAEAKERKAAKKSGAVVNPESCCHKLAADAGLRARGARLEVYVRDDEDNNETGSGGAVVCRHHFRRGDCTVKRCRLMHDERCTLAHIRNVRRDPDAATNGDVEDVIGAPSVPEPRCLPPQPLHETLPLTDWGALMYITVDDECVFDYAAPSVWNKWITAHRAAATVAAMGRITGGVLTTVNEDGVDEDEEDDDVDDDDEDNDGNADETSDGDVVEVRGDRDAGVNITPRRAATPCQKGSRGSRSFFCGEAGLVARCPPAMALLFALIAVKDMAAVMQCCKAMKTCALRDDGYRQRRREALALVASKLSKQKKDDKKKRAKNANVKKTDKKDGFARGGPGR